MNLALIYLKKQEFTSALEYANLAQNIQKDNEKISYLIQKISQMQEEMRSDPVIKDKKNKINTNKPNVESLSSQHSRKSSTI